MEQKNLELQKRGNAEECAGGDAAEVQWAEGESVSAVPGSGGAFSTGAVPEGCGLWERLGLKSTFSKN